MRLEIQGRIVEVDDSFASLSPEEQQRTVNEIAATLRPSTKAEPIPGGAPAAYALSTANSLMLGVPELVARGMGAGPRIDATRAESPYASSAGDLSGMVSPATIGAKLIGGGIIKGGSRLLGGARAPEAVAAGEAAVVRTIDRNQQLYRNATTKLDETEAFYRANPDLPDAKRMFDNARKEFNDIAADLNRVEKMAAKERGSDLLSRTGRAAARTTGGIMGLQGGYGMLEAARNQQGYGAGLVRGMDEAGRTIRDFPITQAIPGAPQVSTGITSILPGAVGYGSMMYNRAIDQQIREEALRRALQGQPQ